MNHFAWLVLGAIVQTSLVVTTTLALLVMTRRRAARMRVCTGATGFALVLVLTAAAASPWPSWSPRAVKRISLSSAPAAAGRRADSYTDRPHGGGSVERGVAFEAPAGDARIEPDERTAQWGWLGPVFGLAELPSATGIAQPATTDGQRSRWPTWCGWLFVAGLIVGLVRLALAAWATRSLRKGSRRISDCRVGEMVDILRAQLSLQRKVEVVESSHLPTAATVGWRRPIVVLPADWREWSDVQLQAVLAHELVHVEHRDFPLWLMAQSTLAVHYYHPLLHLLARHLRLDQELAADAVAARLAGGPQRYLESLAQLALRPNRGRLCWSAQTFLPTRETFLRRIEMLRDPNRTSVRFSTSFQTASLVTLAASAVLAVGLRPPYSTAQTQLPGGGPGQEAPAALGEKSEQRESLSLAYVPAESIWLASLRPNVFLARPQFKDVAQLLRGKGEEDGLFIDPGQLAQVTVAEWQSGDRLGPPRTGFILRFSDPSTLTNAYDSMLKDARPYPVGDREQNRLPRVYAYQPMRLAVFCRASADTLLVADRREVLEQMLVVGQPGPISAPWFDPWQGVSHGDAAAVVNIGALKPELRRELQRDGLAAASLAPLWELVSMYTAQARFNGDQFQVEVTAYSTSTPVTKKVRETAGAGLVMAKNMLSVLRQQARGEPSGPQISTTIADLFEPLLAEIHVTSDRMTVTASSHVSPQQVAALGASLPPAILGAQRAARQVQSINNMKQIALALLNYEATHRRFPAASIVGPDGTTRHSWRVEILPFLEESSLYRQYDLNQAWDSPANQQVLENMPVVFRNPSDDPNSTHSSYFVITGPGTVFDDEDGTQFTEITDGASKTILIVEAKRPIPWTKPEDIQFDPEGPLPELGGYGPGILVGFADGSVRRIQSIAPENVRQWILKADGGTSRSFEPPRAR